MGVQGRLCALSAFAAVLKTRLDCMQQARKPLLGGVAGALEIGLMLFGKGASRCWARLRPFRKSRRRCLGQAQTADCRICHTACVIPGKGRKWRFSHLVREREGRACFSVVESTFRVRKNREMRVSRAMFPGRNEGDSGRFRVKIGGKSDTFSTLIAPNGTAGTFGLAL